MHCCLVAHKGKGSNITGDAIVYTLQSANQVITLFEREREALIKLGSEHTAVSVHCVECAHTTKLFAGTLTWYADYGNFR